MPEYRVSAAAGDGCELLAKKMATTRRRIELQNKMVIKTRSQIVLLTSDIKKTFVHGWRNDRLNSVSDIFHRTSDPGSEK